MDVKDFLWTISQGGFIISSGELFLREAKSDLATSTPLMNSRRWRRKA